MKCTLPEPDRSGWDNRDYYDDVISELWKVLDLVGEMRKAQMSRDKFLQRFLHGILPDKQACEEYRANKEEVKRLENEVDEWFNELRNL